MMKQHQDAFTSFLSAMGLTVGITDIYNYLNIILICLSIGNIIFMLVLRVIDRVKAKQYEQIGNDVNDAITAINDVKDKIDKQGGE